ncbi:hypothetical protein DPMN_061208 [Dreissena polymorpha]|uniref:Uncharacterized protein n=1 Tax=Dreissena polymorpha TaxID=45954 RepID=A0A9D4C795_DREPO|nr:hypothetical protein DPMN_061208 [Dreissena polymorpha]
MQSLQVSYNEKLHEIRQTRQKINTILDEIENTTLKELDAKMTSLKAALNTELENCNKLKHELKRLSNAIENIIDKGKAELIFIASKKCLKKIKQCETYLKENSVQVEKILAFQADSDVQQYLSKLSGLGRFVVCTQAVHLQGDPDQVLTVHKKSEYYLKIDSGGSVFGFFKNLWSDCAITAICVLSNDQILVAEHILVAYQFYNNIQLLNHQYQVVSQYKLTAHPHDICQITPSEVAVVVNNHNTHEVQFVSMHDSRLLMGTKLKFEHSCFGIARYRKNFYLTAETALYLSN